MGFFFPYNKELWPYILCLLHTLIYHPISRDFCINVSIKRSWFRTVKHALCVQGLIPGKRTPSVVVDRFNCRNLLVNAGHRKNEQFALQPRIMLPCTSLVSRIIILEKSQDTRNFWKISPKAPHTRQGLLLSGNKETCWLSLSRALTTPNSKLGTFKCVFIS